MEANTALETGPDGCRDSILLIDWHLVAAATDLVLRKLVSPRLFGPITSPGATRRARSMSGRALASTVVRASKGFIQEGKVARPYHGWNYDHSGQCVLMRYAPQDRPPRKARAIAHRAVEEHGLVWGCLRTPEDEVVPFSEWDGASYKKGRLRPVQVQIRVSHGREHLRPDAFAICPRGQWCVRSIRPDPAMRCGGHPGRDRNIRNTRHPAVRRSPQEPGHRLLRL